MTDTIKILVSRLAWTNVTNGLKTGLITNNGDSSIRYRESTTQPSSADTFGHVIHPQQEVYFNLTGGASIWALGFANDAKVAITGGLGVTKDLSFNRDFYFEVTQGNILGHRAINKYGSNPDVPSTGVEEDVWRAGGTLIHLQIADTMDVWSSNINDSLTGTGARQIVIDGLDSNFNEISETIGLNGTTPVTTVNSYLRIQRARVEFVGTYGGSNLGGITISDSGAISVQAFIETDEGLSDSTHYTVPAGKTAYLLKPAIITDSGKSVDVHLLERPMADVVSAPYSGKFHRQHWGGLNTPFADPYRTFKKFEEKTDIWFTCVNNGGTASAIGVDYDLIVVDN